MQTDTGASAEKRVSKKEYLKDWIPYTMKRYWVYMVFSLTSLVLPWITIGGNHLFLLSFDHKKFHLAGIAFDMQELLPLVFLLMILFVGIFSMTAIGGRVWCGWVCPHTIFRVIYRDFIETKLLGLRKRITNKQQKPDMKLPVNQIKKVVAILLWSVLALIASANFLWFFVPPEEFFEYLKNPMEHGLLFGMLLTLALLLVADIVFIKEDFCVYVCPYSRVQSVLYDDDTVMTIYDPHRGGDIYQGHSNDRHKAYSKQKELRADFPEAECMTCEKCVEVCPTNIDIRKGLQLECINCLECVDACTTVMATQGKPSLISWSSEKEILKQEGKTNFKRPKVVAYLGVLAAIFVALFLASTSKENMLLNINKSQQLYKILDNGNVQNSYVFLFQNTDNKKHEYHFEIEGLEGLKIIRPRKPFRMSAGAKKKKVVILETDQMLVKSNEKDTPLPMTIKAYAVDDKEEIVVFRQAVFVYPRLDILKAKTKK